MTRLEVKLKRSKYVVPRTLTDPLDYYESSAMAPLLNDFLGRLYDAIRVRKAAVPEAIYKAQFHNLTQLLQPLLGNLGPGIIGGGHRCT